VPESIVAYDLSKGHLEKLVQLNDFFPTVVTWNPSGEEAIAAESSGICANVAWLTSAGVKPVTASLGEGSKRWQLGDQFRSPSADCSEQGRADWPAWSSKGQQVLFLASPGSIGLSGQSRLDAPWNIYSMDVREQHPTALLEGLKHARSLTASPNGAWVAFSATDVPGGQGGTWLFSPSSKKLIQVSTDKMDWLAWSPDGLRLAGMFYVGDNWPPVSNVLIFDVSEAL
jgi:Tol biopolymer transport system component